MIARGSSVALGSGWLSGIAASTPVTAARMTERAAAPFAHERKDRRHRGIRSQFRFDEVDAARKGALVEEQHPIGLANGMMSARTPVSPAIMAWEPMRLN